MKKISTSRCRHLENTWDEKKKKNIYVNIVHTPSIRYDRKKEKKYPTQMNDIVTPGFLLLPTHTVYC